MHPQLLAAREKSKTLLSKEAHSNNGVPVQHIEVCSQKERDAAIDKFGSGAKTTFTPKKFVGNTKRNALAFFKKQTQMSADSKAHAEALVKQLKETGRLHAPFWDPKIINSDRHPFVLEALHAAACDREVECGVIDYAFGEDPSNIHFEEYEKQWHWHEWENLKTFLPEYLSDLGKSPLDMDGEGKPTSWKAKQELTITVDLSCVSFPSEEADPEFTELLFRRNRSPRSNKQL